MSHASYRPSYRLENKLSHYMGLGGDSHEKGSRKGQNPEALLMHGYAEGGSVERDDEPIKNKRHGGPIKEAVSRFKPSMKRRDLGGLSRRRGGKVEDSDERGSRDVLHHAQKRAAEPFRMSHEEKPVKRAAGGSGKIRNVKFLGD